MHYTSSRWTTQQPPSPHSRSIHAQPFAGGRAHSICLQHAVAAKYGKQLVNHLALTGPRGVEAHSPRRQAPTGTEPGRASPPGLGLRGYCTLGTKREPIADRAVAASSKRRTPSLADRAVATSSEHKAPSVWETSCEPLASPGVPYLSISTCQ